MSFFPQTASLTVFFLPVCFSLSLPLLGVELVDASVDVCMHCTREIHRPYGEIWFRDAYQFLFFDCSFFRLKPKDFSNDTHSRTMNMKGRFYYLVFFFSVFLLENRLFYEIFYQFHAIKLVSTKIKHFFLHEKSTKNQQK